MNTRVLIADDEELERRAIRKILEDETGLEIVEAENGFAALKVMAEAPVAIAILDIKMPGLDGIAVAEKLREAHPDVAVVFLTAYDQFDYARSALRLQVDDFLLKPASPAEVVATVRNMLARVASREGARESSRAALVRLESAITLVTQRLRHDLSEGVPDIEEVGKFLHLQGMEGRSLAILECRAQPSSGLIHVAKWAESWFSVGQTVALAAVRGQTLRVMRMGVENETGEAQLARIRQFRDAVRAESGCQLLVGAALAATDAHPDALVTAAHRAASLATTANPVMQVSLGAEGEKKPHTPHLPPAVEKALALVEARMADDISLNEVAAAVGLSPSHLSRQLARATGNGFAECLALFRIAAAKRYLRDAALTVKEVAHLVGFHDPAYFARVFRRLEGTSPADFRTDSRREKEAAP